MRQLLTPRPLFPAIVIEYKLLKLFYGVSSLNNPDSENFFGPTFHFPFVSNNTEAPKQMKFEVGNCIISLSPK